MRGKKQLGTPAMRLALAALLSALAAPVAAAPLPEPVAAMLRAAGDDALATVAAVAKKANPGSTAEVDALVAEITAERTAARVARLADQGFIQGWSGEGAFGGTFTTGNTEERGIAASLAVRKEGLRWRHELEARADFQKSDGIKTRERLLAGYQGNYMLSSRLYAYGLLQWEKDQFVGYDRRFTEGAGLGWIAVNGERLRLALEAGPALRQTLYVTGVDENRVSAYGKLNLRWNISKDIAFTEEAGYLVARGNDTAFANSALTAILFGDLSARLSFDVLHETDPQAGRRNTDTITRVSVVYDF
jgi:putative salt-induced outer membrane protein